MSDKFDEWWSAYLKVSSLNEMFLSFKDVSWIRQEMKHAFNHTIPSTSDQRQRNGGTMQITIYIYHTGAPDDPSKMTDTLVDRIEYGGQVIEFEDGEIRITPMAEKIEKPDRQGRCTAWQECILKYCGECEHGCSYYKPARRPNMPAVMHW